MTHDTEGRKGPLTAKYLIEEGERRNVDEAVCICGPRSSRKNPDCKGHPKPATEPTTPPEPKKNWLQECSDGIDKILKEKPLQGFNAPATPVQADEVVDLEAVSSWMGKYGPDRTDRTFGEIRAASIMAGLQQENERLGASSGFFQQQSVDLLKSLNAAEAKLDAAREGFRKIMAVECWELCGDCGRPMSYHVSEAILKEISDDEKA